MSQRRRQTDDQVVPIPPPPKVKAGDRMLCLFPLTREPASKTTPFPWINCSKHGLQPNRYSICQHIRAGLEAIDTLMPPHPLVGGVLLCADCGKKEMTSADDCVAFANSLTAVCIQCAIDAGLPE